jgi:hypothetical protein
MGRLTIEITDKQHQSLKALAELEGKTINQYVLERLFPGDVSVRATPAITRRRNIADALAMPGISDIEFEPPRVNIETRSVDFS